MLLSFPLLELGNPVLAGGRPGHLGLALASCDSRDHSVLPVGLADSQASSSVSQLLSVLSLALFLQLPLAWTCGESWDLPGKMEGGL